MHLSAELVDGTKMKNRHIDGEEFGTSSEQNPCRGWGRGGEVRKDRIYSNFTTIHIKHSIYVHMDVKRHEGIEFFFENPKFTFLKARA